jgi:hypothetical protein
LKTAIVFDWESLCLEGSQRRFWYAAHDPDPVIAQISAVNLGLESEFPIIGTYKAYVQPIDRSGDRNGSSRLMGSLSEPGVRRP